MDARELNARARAHVGGLVPLIYYLSPPSFVRFRDLRDEYEALDSAVLGVSTDHETSHGKFIAKYGLNFSLLADTDRCERGGACVLCL